jgi:BirA family biotin operon repressor/biotin-[acetyl-CoA-carboxylase] ligase
LKNFTDKAEIFTLESGQGSPIKLLRFASLPSSNATAVALARNGEPEWTVVWALEQTAGKGRYNRRWSSPSGLGLYFSVILRPAINNNQLQLLNLATALTIRNFMATLLNKNPLQTEPLLQLKWPNDILLNQRKVCGILLESSFNAGHPEYVVAGIGINLNQQPGDFPPDIRHGAGSLAMVSGKRYDLQQTLNSFLPACQQSLTADIRSGFQDTTERYQQHLAYLNREMTIKLQNRTVTGMVLGIDEAGYLRMKIDNRVKRVYSMDL